jgi:hypothetical protein
MAVETVSSATAQSLKAGRGREDWKQFFKLMASAIALKEDMPMTPGTDELSIYREVSRLAAELRVISLLETVRPALELVIADERVRAEHPDDLYLLELDAAKNTVTYEMFPRSSFLNALQAYSAAEQMQVNNPSVHSVLVSVRNIEALRSAYPSYFMDMKQFITLIREAVDLGADHRPIKDADDY